MKPTRFTLLLSTFIPTSVHVSGNYVPIIRRTYCIYATLVFFTLYGCTLLLTIFIPTSLHVSGNYVPIIRRTYCFYATLVYFTLCGWLSGLQIRQPPDSNGSSSKTSKVSSNFLPTFWDNLSVPSAKVFGFRP